MNSVLDNNEAHEAADVPDPEIPYIENELPTLATPVGATGIANGMNGTTSHRGPLPAMDIPLPGQTPQTIGLGEDNVDRRTKFSGRQVQMMAIGNTRIL